MKKYGHFRGSRSRWAYPHASAPRRRRQTRGARPSTCNRSTRWRPSVSTATPRRGMMSHGLIHGFQTRSGWASSPRPTSRSRKFSRRRQRRDIELRARSELHLSDHGRRRPWRVRRTRINLDLLACRNSRPDQLHGRDGRGRRRRLQSPRLSPGSMFTSPIILPDANDDVIGRFTVEVTPQELAAVMPNVGDTFDETITLGPCFDERADEGGCVKGTGIPDPAEYTFTYRFTRLPVVP